MLTDSHARSFAFWRNFGHFDWQICFSWKMVLWGEFLICTPHQHWIYLHQNSANWESPTFLLTYWPMWLFFALFKTQTKKYNGLACCCRIHAMGPTVARPLEIYHHSLWLLRQPERCCNVLGKVMPRRRKSTNDAPKSDPVLSTGDMSTQKMWQISSTYRSADWIKKMN